MLQEQYPFELANLGYTILTINAGGKCKGHSRPGLQVTTREPNSFELGSKFHFKKLVSILFR